MAGKPHGKRKVALTKTEMQQAAVAREGTAAAPDRR
jgi:hypothetical protein